MPTGLARVLGATLCLLTLLCVSGCRGAGRPAELWLLISVDTLRADRLGAYGSDRGLTPELDALAARSAVFTAAYAPSSLTLPSLAALFTGRYPEQLGVLGNGSLLPPDAPTLAGALRARGFATGAAVGSSILTRRSGLDAGFDVYDDELPQREAARARHERTAPDQTRAALRVLDALLGTGARRLFLWVHYQDPHGPYTPPEALRARSLARERSAADGARELPVRTGPAREGSLPSYQALGDERSVAFYRAGYDGEVRHVDAWVGALLRGVAERALLDGATVVFTADHGESLGEGEYWFAHGEYLSDALVRVPLLIRAPGVLPGRRDLAASLVDLAPTLLARAPGEVPPLPGPGRDLLGPGVAGPGRPNRSEPPIYLATVGGSRVPRRGLVRGEHKLVLTRAGDTWRKQLYRRGPPERPLADAALEAGLTRELEELRRRLAPFAAERSRALTAGEAEALRALGYGHEPRIPPR